MPPRKKAPAAQPPPSRPHTSISHCTFEQGKAAPVNEHLAQAIQDLADAATENARAIAECARTLRGPHQTFGPAVTIGGNQP